MQFNHFQSSLQKTFSEVPVNNIPDFYHFLFRQKRSSLYQKRFNMVTEEQKDIIKSSFPRILIHTLKNGTMVYEKLFLDVPEAKELFKNTPMDKQGQMLVAAIGKIVKGLDHPEIFEKDLVELAKRHIGYGLKPEYFTHFGNALINMFEVSLADNWNKDLHDAWVAVYQEVAGMMKGVIFANQHSL
ncbi:MAG: globin domain-containing protein [Raineya sp.]|jgi:nitric oxide dioxygenase|nr:globin domain-containing protein [Raineya sp.]